MDDYLREIRSLFNVVKVRKPEASRDRSREVYIVATVMILAIDLITSNLMWTVVNL